MFGGSTRSEASVLRAGEPWPRCGNCHRPMQLFVQLTSDELPAEMAARVPEGYVQLFNCTPSEPPPAGAFPPKRIVGWTAVTDHPSTQELEQLGVALAEREPEALDLGDQVPSDGEKLAGWPLWIQGIEYPRCRRCGEAMELPSPSKSSLSR
jgi:hypothetical protein